MSGVLLSLVAATGTYLLYTAVVLGRRGLGGRPLTAVATAARGSRLAARLRDWRVQTGLVEMSSAELAVAAGTMAAAGALGGLVVFGAPLPALVLALALGVGWPAAACRVRRERWRAAGQEAWPRLIEEIRLLTANLGRSVPQALFEAGAHAPRQLRSAFDAAHREWLLSFDFERTIAVLKARLADPTADAACETLLVAHQVGGTDLDRRLEALAADRLFDLEGRKDFRAKQAGVRFSRRFVLLVPCGMALVGTTIGTGRAAYRTSWGQAMVVAGVAVIGGCWVWAGRLLKVPTEERVFQ